MTIPLLPERIVALLTPDRVELRRNAGRGVGRQTLAVTPDAELPAWRAPLATLDAALRAAPPRRGCAVPASFAAPFAAALAPRLDIVLSEHYARWQTLPWQNEIAAPAEQVAYARHSLRETYGEAARHWQVACAERPPGETTPACAIDGELLPYLRQIAMSHGCRLGSARPLFAAAADHWRRKLPRGVVWFAVLEAGRLNLGLLRDRCWLAVHGENLPADDLGEALAGLMARSALAAGLVPDSGRLLLCGEGAERCPVPLASAAVQRLGSALPWLAAVAGARSMT